MGHALNNTLAGHPLPLLAHEGPRRAVAAGHRSRRHRHADGGRAPARRSGEDRRAMGREAFLERVWAWKAESGGAIVGQLKRLGASCDWSPRALHARRGPVEGGRQGVRAALSRGADLSRQAARQLGPEVPDRDLRPRSRAGRVQGLVQMVARGRRAARRGGARQGAGEEPERPSLSFRLSRG